MNHTPGALLRMAVLIAATLLFTGCVTNKKYRMAKDDTPPAQPLGWSVAVPAAELALENVIVFKGPGSWKNEARWDEYRVKFTNRGDGPLIINDVTLIDVLSQTQVPGADPWVLESLSEKNWDSYTKTGLKVLAGAGVAALYVAAMASTVSMGLGAGAAAGAGAVSALTLLPVVALVDITAVAFMNHSNRNQVRAEFDRRRLVQPLTIAPGASVSGSYFFPMVPGPQRLIVRGWTGEKPLELTLELKPLAHLHLAP